MCRFKKPLAIRLIIVYSIFYVSYSDERVLTEVHKVVDRIWKKRKRDEMFDDVFIFTQEKRAATLVALSDKGRLLAGLVDRATSLVKSSYPTLQIFRSTT
jgi:hypothetical protein